MRSMRVLLAAVVASIFGVSCSHSPQSTATLAVAPQGGPAPAGAATRPAIAPQTYVLVHGAWAGGWEWKRTGDILAKRGHTVYRPTYTGQGEREHLASPDIDLNTYIQDVVNIILFEDLHDIVLLGHSFGGMVVTGVADRVPDRIKCLIYLDAALPVDGESRLTAATTRPAPRAVNGFIPLPGNLSPEAIAARKPPYIVQMPLKAQTTPLSLKNQAAALKIPTAYIMTVDAGRTPEQDNYWPYYQRAQARSWHVSVMTGDHVVHINQSENLCDRLEKALGDARPATAK